MIFREPYSNFFGFYGLLGRGDLFVSLNPKPFTPNAAEKSRVQSVGFVAAGFEFMQWLFNPNSVSF